MKVVAFTYVLDEREYVKENILNSFAQGLVPVWINNGCSDGAKTEVRNLHTLVVDHITPTFELHDLISFGAEIAKGVGADWYILKDADELMETYDDRLVVEVIEEADKAGYNCVNFDSYSFWPTTTDDPNVEPFHKRIRHYTFFDIPYIRAVKVSPEIWLDHPHTPGGTLRQAPYNLVIRHYKFLDAEQGRRKVWTRRARYDKANIERGSHTHYRYFGMTEGYYVLEPEIADLLNVYNEDHQWVRKQVWNEWR